MSTHTLPRRPRPLPASDDNAIAITLAGEHRTLLRDLRRRAAPVLALARARSWPEDELRVLTAFLRGAVLPQAFREEATLYPDQAPTSLAGLRSEHAQLHALTDRLDGANVRSCTRRELVQMVDEVLRVLEHHVAAEDALLSAARAEAPAAQVEPAPIELDQLPPERAIQMCIEQILRLVPGQSTQVHSVHEVQLRTVDRWVRGFDPTQYATRRVQGDLTPMPLRIIRRSQAQGCPPLEFDRWGF